MYSIAASLVFAALLQSGDCSGNSSHANIVLASFSKLKHIRLLFASCSCDKAAEASARSANAGEEHGSFWCSFLCSANRRHSLGMGQFQARAARNGPWLCAGAATAESGRTRRDHLCLCWLGACLCPSRCSLALCSITAKADPQIHCELATIVTLVIFQTCLVPSLPLVLGLLTPEWQGVPGYHGKAWLIARG